MVSRLQFARAVCLTIATILAATPVLAATCELACSHPSAKNHTGTQTSHHYHATAAQSASDAVSAVVNAARERDCCRDTGLTAAATSVNRSDAKVFVPSYSLAATSAAFVHPVPASSAVTTRGAPPGRSPDSARSLPLRI